MNYQIRNINFQTKSQYSALQLYTLLTYTRCYHRLLLSHLNHYPYTYSSTKRVWLAVNFNTIGQLRRAKRTIAKILMQTQ